MHDLERWRGKTALVTGASAGIGESLVRMLTGAGIRVVAVARRMERLEQLAANSKGPGQVLPRVCDLENPGEIEALFQWAQAETGGVEILINNAGLGRKLSFAEGESQAWQQMLDLNIRALALCSQHALRGMRGKQDAAIVNISSTAGHRVPQAGSGGTFYSATKHAVKALTEGLRAELVLEKSPIKVGMVSPAMVRTEFQQVADRGEQTPEEHYPYRVLDAEDVVYAVWFILAAPRHVQISDVLMRSVESAA